MDNTLPKYDATEILPLLKKDERYKTIPVVIYYTSISASKKEKLMAMGAHACLEKGSTMKEVVETVKKFKNIAETKSNP